MIDATQRKLREAQFFYRKLVAERQKPSINDPEAFRYYFSAFIGAARSVTFVLKCEEKEKYEAWKPEWLTPDEKNLMKLTNDLRVDEVKKLGADMIVEPEEIAIHELISSDLERSHPAYGMHSSAAPVLTGFYLRPKTFRAAYYLAEEDGKAEVTAVCERYLKFLEKVVSEFRSAHE